MGLRLNRLRDATPLGLGTLELLSQGSREARQPWALLLNRFAVERLFKRRSAARVRLVCAKPHDT